MFRAPSQIFTPVFFKILTIRSSQSPFAEEERYEQRTRHDDAEVFDKFPFQPFQKPERQERKRAEDDTHARQPNERAQYFFLDGMGIFKPNPLVFNR